VVPTFYLHDLSFCYDILSSTLYHLIYPPLCMLLHSSAATTTFYFSRTLQRFRVNISYRRCRIMVAAARQNLNSGLFLSYDALPSACLCALSAPRLLLRSSRRGVKNRRFAPQTLLYAACSTAAETYLIAVSM